MTNDKSRQSQSNFLKFVREISEASNLLDAFDDDPERVMSEAGLTDEEKEVIHRGDEAEILMTIGGTPEHGAILTLNIKPYRRRRRRPPPPA